MLEHASPLDVLFLVITLGIVTVYGTVQVYRGVIQDDRTSAARDIFLCLGAVAIILLTGLYP